MSNLNPLSQEGEPSVRGENVWCVVRQSDEQKVKAFVTCRDLQTGTVLVLCATWKGFYTGRIKIGEPIKLENLPIFGETEYVIN